MPPPVLGYDQRFRLVNGTLVFFKPRQRTRQIVHEILRSEAMNAGGNLYFYVANAGTW